MSKPLTKPTLVRLGVKDIRNCMVVDGNFIVLVHAIPDGGIYVMHLSIARTVEAAVATHQALASESELVFANSLPMATAVDLQQRLYKMQPKLYLHTMLSRSIDPNGYVEVFALTKAQSAQAVSLRQKAHPSDWRAKNADTD